ncbi:MAG: nuclear transport factor 2 family protein [Candidatus Aminicenantes bacterium]|nr:nuclear transport factor 2 family protein [Candidatus Aminicenantes bacterium]
MKEPSLILPLALISCFVVGCQDKAAMTELEKYKAQTALEEQNKAIANRAWEASSKGDFETLRELGAPEYVWYLPSNSTKPISKEEAIEKAKRLHSAFPDINFRIEELLSRAENKCHQISLSPG